MEAAAKAAKKTFLGEFGTTRGNVTSHTQTQEIPIIGRPLKCRPP